MFARDQAEIIRDVLLASVEQMPQDWLECRLALQVSDGVDEGLWSYVIDRGHGSEEHVIEDLALVIDLVDELRDALAPSSNQAFPQVWLHFLSDGNFDARYGYAPVTVPMTEHDWNFPEAHHP